MTKTPFSFTVDIFVKPGFEAKFVELVSGVLTAMRYEPSFINTFLNVDPKKPGHFMLFETWFDEEDFFSNQMKKPYRTEYEAKLLEMVSAPREIKIYKPLRSDFSVRHGEQVVVPL